MKLTTSEAEREVITVYVGRVHLQDEPHHVGLSVEEQFFCPFDHRHDDKAAAVHCVFVANGQIGEFNGHRWARVARRWSAKHARPLHP